MSAPASSVRAAALVQTARPRPPEEVAIDRPRTEDAAMAATVATVRDWTVLGVDAWNWFAGSGMLRRSSCRAVRAPARSCGSTSRRPRRPDRLLATAARWPHGRVPPARGGRRAGAGDVRRRSGSSLGRGDASEGTLARACTLVGFIQRPEAALLSSRTGRSSTTCA